MYTLDELYHHGILGQRWGVRRYQNKDGSLTKAGLKRYGSESNFNKIVKAEAKAKKEAEAAKFSKRTEAELAKIRKKYRIPSPEKEDKNTKASKKEKSIEEMTEAEIREKINRTKLENELRNVLPKRSKNKPISEMTDQELEDRISRIQLENKLRDLTPKQVSTGQRFLNTLADVAVPAIKNAARDGAEKWLKKQFAELTGTDGKTADDISRELERQAKDLRNRVSIGNSRRLLGLDNNQNQNGNQNSNQNQNNSNTNNNRPSNQNQNNSNTNNNRPSNQNNTGNSGSSQSNNSSPNTNRPSNQNNTGNSGSSQSTNSSSTNSSSPRRTYNLPTSGIRPTHRTFSITNRPTSSNNSSNNGSAQSTNSSSSPLTLTTPINMTNSILNSNRRTYTLPTSGTRPTHRTFSITNRPTSSNNSSNSASSQSTNSSSTNSSSPRRTYALPDPNNRTRNMVYRRRRS